MFFISEVFFYWWVFYYMKKVSARKKNLKNVYEEEKAEIKIFNLSKILLYKTSSDVLYANQENFQKWSHNNFLRDGIIIFCKCKKSQLEVFFKKEVRFFPEKDIFVTIQIDGRTISGVRFSVVWTTSAFSKLSKFNFFCSVYFRTESFFISSWTNWC